tara:strand:+ start:396 stop:917 length:522 start_codon:yes stop_codon:yes gene_type:complete
MEDKGTKSSLTIRDNKEKLIIYFVGIAVFLAVLVGIKELSKGDFSAPIFLGFFTGIYTLWRFCKKQKENPFSSIFKILKDDYVFDKYVTLKIFSIIYALGQGIGIGASIGYFADWIHSLVTDSYLKGTYFSGLMISLLSIIFLRITLEIYSIIYKAALEFRNFVKSKEKEVIL